MARDDILEPIRTRAYLLWEQAGRPEGGDLDFWDRARREIEAEQAGKGSAVPDPAAGAKEHPL